MPRGRVARRSFGLQRGRSVGRLTEWFGTIFGTDATTLPASTGLLALVMTAAELAKRPFTITRTVGLLSVQSDQNAAPEFPFGALGGLVVSEKAIATGFTAVPDPVTESDSDLWFLYQSFSAEGSASTNVGRPLMQFPLDSRAQRKVQDGEEFAFVIANASAADGLNFFLNLRILVKLS